MLLATVEEMHILPSCGGEVNFSGAVRLFIYQPPLPLLLGPFAVKIPIFKVE